MKLPVRSAKRQNACYDSRQFGVFNFTHKPGEEVTTLAPYPAKQPILKQA